MANLPPVSFKVSDTISAYRAVRISAADTVALYNATATIAPIGVTVDEVKTAGGGAVPVAGPGSIAKLYFNDTVAAGGFVAINSVGEGVPHTTVTAGSYVIGVLAGPAVSATGTIADVYVMPHLRSIP